jgi:alpha-ketoglutarate-dependent 2,4-dichlorophenoxyacetate dioxygenase
MPIETRQLHPLFVGEVSGIDLSQPLATQDRDDIVAAVNRYAVLVFRGQQLTNDQQIAFGERFGALEDHTARYRNGDRARLPREMADISNLDVQDRVRPADDRRSVRALGNRLWHTDSSFMRVPAALSMLFAHAVPATGGETEFADLRAAWDALSEAVKAQVEPLVAEHHYLHSRAVIGFTDFTEEERSAMPPVPQRVVRVHPGSRRKTLYLASHASHIVGWPVAEGRLLLMDLMAHATQRSFVYSHTWRVGDLVIWDNRCTMHRGRPYDLTQTRDLRRVTTQDAASTMDAEPISVRA